MEEGPTPVLVYPQSRDCDSVDIGLYKGDEMRWFWSGKLPALGLLRSGKWP